MVDGLGPGGLGLDVDRMEFDQKRQVGPKRSCRVHVESEIESGRCDFDEDTCKDKVPKRQQFDGSVVYSRG